MDRHEVLGLFRNPSPEEIRAAYLKLVKKHHPDVNPGDLAAERRIKQINEAYYRLTTSAYHLPRSPIRSADILGRGRRIILGALVAPSLALYSLGMSPFRLEQRNAPQYAEQSAAPAPKVAVLRPAAQPAMEYTGALPASPPTVEAASGQPDITSSVEVPASEAVHRVEPNLALLREPEMARINLAEAMQFAIQPPARQLVPAAGAKHGFGASAAAPHRSREESFEMPTSQRNSSLKRREKHPWPVADETTTGPARRARDDRRRSKGLGRETGQRGTAAALRAYISGYPSGNHVDQAEEKLAAIEEQALDRKKFQRLEQGSAGRYTRAGYEAYLRAEPDGGHVGDAKRRIRRQRNRWPVARTRHGRRPIGSARAAITAL